MPADYIMVEYLSKVGDFIEKIPERKYNLRDQNELKEMVNDILSNQYIQLMRKISEDIQGQMDQMNTVGFKYLADKISIYRKVTLICHAISSIIIYISFYFLITKPIKKQLRAMDSLNNIVFSIPSAVYNVSPKLKEYV